MTCLLCYETSFAIVEIETLWLSRIEIWGARITSILSVFPKWLDGLQRCFSCCSLPILLCNGQNIAECEAYWLMGFPIINIWAHVSRVYFLFYYFRGHLQTDFVTLNVIMTLGGGVLPRDVINLFS